MPKKSTLEESADGLVVPATAADLESSDRYDAQGAALERKIARLRTEIKENAESLKESRAREHSAATALARAERNFEDAIASGNGQPDEGAMHRAADQCRVASAEVAGRERRVVNLAGELERAADDLEACRTLSKQAEFVEIARQVDAGMESLAPALRRLIVLLFEIPEERRIDFVRWLDEKGNGIPISQGVRVLPRLCLAGEPERPAHFSVRDEFQKLVPAAFYGQVLRQGDYELDGI